MAKEEKAGDVAETPPKKSKKLLIIIVAAVLVVVLIGGAAAFLLLKKGGDAAEGDEVAAETDKAAKKKTEKAAPPVYIPMDAFTVNLVPETGEQYLQVTISVEAEDAAVAEKLKQYMPKLRHEIMNILSSKKPSEIATREGKKQLADEIKTTINGIVDVEPAKGKTSEGAVRAVLFTTFIIQ